MVLKNCQKFHIEMTVQICSFELISLYSRRPYTFTLRFSRRASTFTCKDSPVWVNCLTHWSSGLFSNNRLVCLHVVMSIESNWLNQWPGHYDRALSSQMDHLCFISRPPNLKQMVVNWTTDRPFWLISVTKTGSLVRWPIFWAWNTKVQSQKHVTSYALFHHVIISIEQVTLCSRNKTEISLSTLKTRWILL